MRCWCLCYLHLFSTVRLDTQWSLYACIVRCASRGPYSTIAPQFKVRYCTAYLVVSFGVCPADTRSMSSDARPRRKTLHKIALEWWQCCQLSPDVYLWQRYRIRVGHPWIGWDLTARHLIPVVKETGAREMVSLTDPRMRPRYRSICVPWDCLTILRCTLSEPRKGFAKQVPSGNKRCADYITMHPFRAEKGVC